MTFRCTRSSGDIPGATLVDWPISYAEFCAPYYRPSPEEGHRGLGRGRGQPFRGTAQRTVSHAGVAGAPHRRRDRSGVQDPRLPFLSHSARDPQHATRRSRRLFVPARCAPSMAVKPVPREARRRRFLPEAVATGRCEIRTQVAWSTTIELRQARPCQGSRLLRRSRRRAASLGPRSGRLVHGHRIGPAPAQFHQQPLSEGARQPQWPGRQERHLRPQCRGLRAVRPVPVRKPSPPG